MAILAKTAVAQSGKARALGDNFELIDSYPGLRTPSHIAELIGFAVHHVRKLCREHKVLAVQIGVRQQFMLNLRFVKHMSGEDVA